MPAIKVIMKFKDVNGRPGTTHWYQSDTSANIATAINNTTVAACLSASYVVNRAFTNPPTNGTYKSAKDKAIFHFRNGNELTKFDLPGPLLPVFLSDGITVDTTECGNLIQAALDTLTGPSLPLAYYVSGTRNFRSRK